MDKMMLYSRSSQHYKSRMVTASVLHPLTGLKGLKRLNSYSGLSVRMIHSDLSQRLFAELFKHVIHPGTPHDSPHGWRHRIGTQKIKTNSAGI